MANLLVENGLPLSGTTAQRPTNAAQGQRYYDESIGTMLIYQDGTASGSPTAGWVPVSGVVAEQVYYTEGAAGTHTGSVSVPAGATILDIIIDAVALWNASTSATLKVGDGADDDGWITNCNLKATDLLAGESLSLALAGGKGGVYLTGAASQATNRYSASARTISGIITTVGAGTTGRTRMTVIYCLPRVKAATFA